MTKSRFENFLTSWKFFLLLVLLQFLLMPVATKGFKFEAAGDLIFYTLGHAFIMDMYPYAVYFQIVMILALGTMRCYNMGNFATDTGFYLGLYHLPLLGMSLFALLSSKRKKNE